MSVTIDLTKHYLDGTLQQILADLPELMKTIALREMDRGADKIVLSAKSKVKVRTGALQSTIRKELEGENIQVIAGGFGVTYAEIIEQRYPYLRPSVEEEAPNIRERITEAVVRSFFQW